jgi:dTDP-4-dehydrorhamnose 3,5-epimerase
VEITPLSIAGAFTITNTVHGDERGEFVEWFRADRIKNATGLDFYAIQGNLSVSQKGTLRGIHFADVSPGQAKYVMCSTGAIQDYVVDIRVGSPTFGTWEAVTVTAKDRNAMLLDVGLGHAFVALEEGTTVTYLVTDHYKPQAEHAINPQDPDLGLEFPFRGDELLVSAKDRDSPNFSEALAGGVLPTWAGR